MSSRLTIAVAARNAAATIARAVSSCLPDAVADPGIDLLLIDDHSTDDTAGIARAVAGDRLRVVRPAEPRGIGFARQTGLDAIRTEFAAWLDADDEWIPGRAARLTSMLTEGADIATESIDLHDGPTGAFLRRLTVPDELRQRGGPIRLFERNTLPGDTQVAFRTDVYRRAGGYDPDIFGPESFDLILRSLSRGARMAFGDEVGYRMFAYPGSVSRNIERQSAAIAATLRKHEYADIERLYHEAGHSERIAAWGLVSVAAFRNEPAVALRFLSTVSGGEDAWRVAFTRGTLLLMQGGRDADAEAALTAAESIEPTAEAANNLGVALARRGRTHAAHRRFALAAERFPGYYDARVNIESETLGRITTHPLRRSASRNDY